MIIGMGRTASPDDAHAKWLYRHQQTCRPWGAEELEQDQKKLEKEKEELDRVANLLSDQNRWLEEENAWLLEAKSQADCKRSGRKR